MPGDRVAALRKLLVVPRGAAEAFSGGDGVNWLVKWGDCEPMGLFNLSISEPILNLWLLNVIECFLEPINGS